MEVKLSYRECTTIIAALRAWKDPIGFFNNGAGRELFERFPALTENEIEFLIRRIKTGWNVPAGGRTTIP